ncbi:MAG: hypothetical protein U1U88_000876 [Lawsonella clevelandensis]
MSTRNRSPRRIEFCRSAGRYYGGGGGFLFWLFGILWGRPSLHILTFGLALAVQVVMVVAARLLRRREEFWVLIFTWAVAFFVTIGPIALVPR